MLHFSMNAIGQSVSRFRMDAKISYTIFYSSYEMFYDKLSIKFFVGLYRNETLKSLSIHIQKMIT